VSVGGEWFAAADAGETSACHVCVASEIPGDGVESSYTAGAMAESVKTISCVR